MPLLHRKSSKENSVKATDTHREAEDDINPSLFQRLRRRSSARSNQSDHGKTPQNHQGGEDGSASAAVTTSNLPSKETPVPEQESSHHRRHSSSRERRSSLRHGSRSREGSTSSKKRSGDPISEHIVGGLTKDDIQHLFQGAPHFMLEKGRRGRYYPQSFFPWNSALDITDLKDRRYIRHESFALATMHSHLPAHDEAKWRPGMEHPRPHEPFETAKRPMFDLGIYERPNMLDFSGLEPGTMGMRTFLEAPVADGLEDEGRDARISKELADLEHMSASEAFKALAHEEGAAQIGKHAPKVDRVLLVKEGAKAWKRIGVRDITIEMIAKRLVQISAMRDDVVQHGWKYTILNFFSAKDLGEQLFSQFLYPPSKIINGHSDQNDLKVQIEALAKVLTTPGAWLNFNLPAERTFFMLNVSTREAVQTDSYGLSAHARRHYSLIQLLLAVELLLRLDAALRLGVAQHVKGHEISSAEIHHFNKLRSLKLDWDFVVARRFLDLCYAKHVDSEDGTTSTPEQPTSPGGGAHGLLKRFKRSLTTTDDNEDAWRCAILPRQPKTMTEGVIQFARSVGWPEERVDAIESALIRKLIVTEEEREKILVTGVERVVHPHVPLSIADKATAELRPAGETTLGGPMSHAWFSGFLIPGYQACDLVMATLLENDAAALQKLGPVAHLRSGFILDSRSWWSKVCIVGAVLAPMDGHHERMGWIGLPSSLVIKDDHDRTIGDGWQIIDTKETPRLRDGARIFDGEALAKESSPLGIGSGHVLSNEFKMITDSILNDIRRPDVNNIELILSESKDASSTTSDDTGISAHASIRFTVTTHSTTNLPLETTTHLWPLQYNVHFIAGHPCRTPHGHAILPSGVKADEIHRHPKHKHAERLPAHPLHQSYRYVTKSIQDLLELDDKAAWLPNPTDKEAGMVWVVDARGEWEREVVARAWCARVGRDAVVARVGTCCLACVIRECRAVEVGVLIRFGNVEQAEEGM